MVKKSNSLSVRINNNRLEGQIRQTVRGLLTSRVLFPCWHFLAHTTITITFAEVHVPKQHFYYGRLNNDADIAKTEPNEAVRSLPGL